MTEIIATILWQRLDVPGHDACRLVRNDNGWQLGGHAIFEHEGAPCSVSYTVLCDAAWQARSASVKGFLGSRELDLEIERSADGWLLNGIAQPGLSDLIDLDLGFTPATNLLALRRFDLAVGQGSPAPAAYLPFPELELRPLEQHYRRQSETEYAYRAPEFRYDAVLSVAPVGFVTDYPALWRGRLLTVT